MVTVVHAEIVTRPDFPLSGSSGRCQFFQTRPCAAPLAPTPAACISPQVLPHGRWSQAYAVVRALLCARFGPFWPAGRSPRLSPTRLSPNDAAMHTANAWACPFRFDRFVFRLKMRLRTFIAPWGPTDWPILPQLCGHPFGLALVLPDLLRQDGGHGVGLQIRYCGSAKGEGAYLAIHQPFT